MQGDKATPITGTHSHATRLGRTIFAGGKSLHPARDDKSKVNVCGQPYSLQIRSHVSKLGARLRLLHQASRRMVPARKAALAAERDRLLHECEHVP